MENSWDIPTVTSMERMFINVSLTPDIYSNFLVECRNQAVSSGVQSDVLLTSTIVPNDDGENAKTLLRNDYNWQIVDGGS